jgi:hypothetical protein
LAIQVGDTFYWKDGGHLWVVISDPHQHCGVFVTVNLTTDLFRAGTDCELDVGSHRWVVKKSYVSYGDARLWGPKEEANLAAQILLGTMKMHSPMVNPALAKIIAAGKVTKALAENFKKYL